MTRKEALRRLNDPWFWNFRLPLAARYAAEMDMGSLPITRERVKLVCEVLPWWTVPEWYWKEPIRKKRRRWFA